MIDAEEFRCELSFQYLAFLETEFLLKGVANERLG
jgi:hypothetical protein